MNSKYFVGFLMLLALTLSLAATPSFNKSNLTYAQPVGDSERPNILILAGDDFGYADIGAFGSEIHTPNLDALASEGKVLDNFHTHPVCAPARATMHTGVDNHIVGLGTMYEDIAPNQVGQPGYETYITDRVVTSAELLRDAGYHTILSGKWHLSGQTNENGTLPSDRGFEESFSLLGGRGHHFNSNELVPGSPVLYEQNGKIVPRPDNTTYSNVLYTDMLIDSIKKFQGDGKPLFMFFSPQVALNPYQAPQDYIKKYEGVYDVGYDKIREQRFEKQKELGFWPADMPLPTRLPEQKLWDSLNATERMYTSKVMQVHAAMIDNLDYHIGRIIQYLKDIGEYDNTLVIFTSDNGSSEPIELNNIVFTGVSPEETKQYLSKNNNSIENIGNPDSAVNFGTWGQAQQVSPLSWFKTQEGEGGARVPFLIRPPVTEPTSGGNNLIKAFAHVQDIHPTLLDYAGVQQPSTYHGHPVSAPPGKSLRPLLDGNVDKLYGDNETVSQEIFNSSAVFMGDWKALKIDPPLSTGQWQLFNLTMDPGENKDISSIHPDILKQMRVDYDKFAKDVGIIVTNESRAGELTAKSSTD
jgi:arylsulfatase